MVVQIPRREGCRLKSKESERKVVVGLGPRRRSPKVVCSRVMSNELSTSVESGAEVGGDVGRKWDTMRVSQQTHA